MNKYLSNCQSISDLIYLLGFCCLCPVTLTPNFPEKKTNIKFEKLVKLLA